MVNQGQSAVLIPGQVSAGGNGAFLQRAAVRKGKCTAEISRRILWEIGVLVKQVEFPAVFVSQILWCTFSGIPPLAEVEFLSMQMSVK